MTSSIDRLLALCKEQPFDAEKIRRFITENRMSREAVTRAALKLCDCGMYAYSDYVYDHEREPQPHELCTHGWEELFGVLTDCGLDASLVFCDDGINRRNLLYFVRNLDTPDLGARILRNLLRAGVSPNLPIDGQPFFEEVDSDLITDLELDLYSQAWQQDNAVHFWLVQVGFGGVIKGGDLPVRMRDGLPPQIFREFERFDCEIVRKKGDFEIRITEKETGRLVATV